TLSERPVRSAGPPNRALPAAAFARTTSDGRIPSTGRPQTVGTLREFARSERLGGPHPDGERVRTTAGGVVLEWLPTAWIGILAVLLLWVPGLAVGYAGGLRGLVAWGSAPLVSSALIGGAAIVAGFAGVPWSVLVVAAATVLAAAVAWGVRALGGGWRSPRVDRSSPVWRRVLVTVAVSVVVAGVLQARRLMAAIGGPDHVSQTFDAPYHPNSVRLILDRGHASSLPKTPTTPGATTSFYPALWHDVVSLIVQLSGSTDVVVAANWTTLVVACLVWPASMLVLARGLFGPRPVMLGLTVAVSFAMTQFPNQLTGFGIL